MFRAFLIFSFMLWAIAADEPPALRTLEVGVERMGERILQGGSAIYKIQGVDPSHTYEVKISSPASTPVNFTITLPENPPSFNRRLLNVDKVIFAASDHMVENVIYLLVKVELVGVLASKPSKAHDFITYNILCERVYFNGIPQQAWWICLLGFLAIACSFLISSRLCRSIEPNDKIT